MHKLCIISVTPKLTTTVKVCTRKDRYERSALLRDLKNGGMMVASQLPHTGENKSGVPGYPNDSGASETRTFKNGKPQ